MKEREGRQIEYKELLSSYSGILKTIVAFSNDIGGKIYVGIEDKTMIPKGLTDEQVEKYLEEIPRAIYDAITPYCMPQLRTLLIDNQVILEIDIVKGARKPYFLKAEGTPKGVYVRIGAHNKKATPELLKDLYREGQRLYWDEEEVEDTILIDLDQEVLRSFYGGGWTETQLLADKVITVSVRGKKVTTNSSVIYFHQKPNTVIPHAELLFSQFEGVTQGKIVKTVDLSAPLPALAEQCIQLLRPSLISSTERENLVLKDVEWEIPLIALRETLMNALIHRQYAISDAIKVALFDDRVEIFSPGNFPGPMNISELGNGVSYSRNPHLRQLARKAGLVEKRGFGYKLILETCEQNNNYPPIVVEGPSYVKVTLFRTRLSLEKKQKLPERFSALGELAMNKSSFQVREASNLMGVSISTARLRLKELVTEGWLDTEGKGRAAKYVWLKVPLKIASQ